MSLRFLATYLADDADQLAAALAAPQFPPHFPPGVRLTLKADYERALAAVELAQLIAWGDVSWESDYAHLSREEDTQTAAAERALEEARVFAGDYSTALSRAHAAVPLAA